VERRERDAADVGCWPNRVACDGGACGWGWARGSVAGRWLRVARAREGGRESEGGGTEGGTEGRRGTDREGRRGREQREGDTQGNSEAGLKQTFRVAGNYMIWNDYATIKLSNLSEYLEM
jgi:hypothetical protein